MPKKKYQYLEEYKTNIRREIKEGVTNVEDEIEEMTEKYNAYVITHDYETAEYYNKIIWFLKYDMTIVRRICNN